MRLLLGRLLQFFLPSQCPCCEQFLEEKQQGLCPSCLSTVQWIEPPLCTVCGSPFASPEAGEHPCGTCRTKRRYFATARALGSYQGVLQEAIHRWKSEERMSLTRLFGQWMTDGLQRFWGFSSFDLLIPVPLHAGRLRERGFNQSFLLAAEISHKTGIPCEKRLLLKIKPTVPQIHLSGGEERKRSRELSGLPTKTGFKRSSSFSSMMSLPREPPSMNVQKSCWLQAPRGWMFSPWPMR